MRLSNLVSILLLSGLVLSACTKPDRQRPEDQFRPEVGHATGTEGESSSSFYVKSLTGRAAIGAIDNETPLKVPATVDVGFEVCLKGRDTNQDLRGQRFSVTDTGRSALATDVRTNNSGCLRWNEDKIAFNYFAGRSGWVVLKRVLVPQGPYTGKVTVDILFNPWAVGEHARDEGDAIVFRRDGNHGFVPPQVYEADQAQQAFDGNLPEQGQAWLTAPEIKVRGVPEGEGGTWVYMHYFVDMKPSVAFRAANGQVVYRKVPDGNLKLKLQLMATNMGPKSNETALLLDDKDPTMTAQVVDGKLQGEISRSQVQKANQSNLELAVKIEPSSSRFSLKPFSGLFPLGAGEVLEDGGGSVRPRCLAENEPACDFDQAVRAASNFEQLKKEGKYLLDNKRYSFSFLKIRFLMVRPGETATQRTIAYTASTCIRDEITGHALSNTPMKITYAPTAGENAYVERKVIRKPTDPSGCLNWDGRVFHKYYQPEQYFERNVTIEKDTGESKPGVDAVADDKFKEKFTFYLNPWDTNINFGFDGREFVQMVGTNKTTLDEIRDRRKIPSRFFVGAFQYHTVRFLYNIDPFMDLEVKKTVLMELDPHVLRYSGIKDARKNVEHMRDGIYLLKVAIQKNYLDPRDNSQFLLKNNKQYRAQLEPLGNDLMVKKSEYITTNQALVRVVDGMIIFPIELTMRDLRLMRVRSNFMVQLETADERLIQAFHVFRDHAIKHEKLNCHLVDKEKAVAAEKQMRADRADKKLEPVPESDLLKDCGAEGVGPEELAKKIARVRMLTVAGIHDLKRRFENPGPLVSYLSSADENEELPEKEEAQEEWLREILKTQIGANSGFYYTRDMLKALRGELKANDFSAKGLPSLNEINLSDIPKDDLYQLFPNLMPENEQKTAGQVGETKAGKGLEPAMDLFAEKDSGLARRSFVGPIIYLSNGYSDSLRATDNLDEANCRPSDEGVDDVFWQANQQMRNTALFNAKEMKDWKQKEKEQQNIKERDLGGSRQNNAYQHNPYFGSLTHLCNKNVDDLIREEEVLKKDYANRQYVASQKYNFVKSYGLQYVSLTDEPLLRVRENCNQSDVRQCLEETKDGVVSSKELELLTSTDLQYGASVWNHTPHTIAEGWGGKPIQATKFEWSKEELPKLFFEPGPNSSAAICNLLANRVAGDLRSNNLSSVDMGILSAKLINACASPSGLIHEVKYHVEETGDYIFLGGLNLNINVGESFSMGWGNSWSAGFEMADLIGVLPLGRSALGGVGVLIKPLSAKKGISLSDSVGTSVSESTYLVSQIAKFNLELKAYEKCAVVRLSDSAIRYLQGKLENWYQVPYLGLGVADFNDRKVQHTLRHGYLVCEGDTRKSNPPQRVNEMYFYFTQHFTEGDMLDQADLYNHPWLLAMRGMRDFVTFAHSIQAQEVVGLPDFVKGATGGTPPRVKAWALDKMADVYKGTLPTFPGFYSMTPRREDGRDEDISAFLLEQSKGMFNTDNFADPLGEVTHRSLIGTRTPVNP